MGSVEGVTKDEFFGRMNDPTAASYVKGICGEEMEFYLVIEDRVITDIKFYTEGCGGTRACGAAVASLAVKKKVEDALRISAGEVIGALAPMPEEHKHCAILAAIALYKAIADYLLRP